MWPFKSPSNFDSKAFADLADTLRALRMEVGELKGTQRQLELEQADLGDRLKRALGRWSQDKRRQPEPAENSAEPEVADVNELIRQGRYSG